MSEFVETLYNRLALEEDRLTWLIEWILAQEISEVTEFLGETLDEIVEAIDINISADTLEELGDIDLEDDV